MACFRGDDLNLLFIHTNGPCLVCHIQEPVRTNDFFFELVQAAIARENAAAPELRLKKELAIAFFKCCLKAEAFRESRIETDFFRARLKRAVMGTL